MLLAVIDDTVIWVFLIATLGGSGTVIAFLFRALITSKDKEMAAKDLANEALAKEREKDFKEMEGFKKSYAEIATEAVRSQVAIVNFYREKEGKTPLVATAPVVAESHSLPTAEQTEAALIQTLRAQVAKVKDMVGQSPRINTIDGPQSPAPEVTSIVEVEHLPVLITEKQNGNDNKSN
jgi:hypothetical protein